MIQAQKPSAREILGLAPQAQQGPFLMHDPGTSATLADMNVFRAATDIFLANNGLITFQDAARAALNNLDVFRAEVTAWNEEKNSANEQSENA